MSQPVVKITADKNGKLNVEVIGAQGQECLALTEPLEKALGFIEDRLPKAESFIEPNTLQNQ